MNPLNKKEWNTMYQDHYFLEKSMEQHNRSLEKESRKWWKRSTKKKPAAPASE